MLKGADNVVMEQEDSASQHGEMRSWDINDIKLPQVRVCVLEIYPVLISLLHFTTDLKCCLSHLCHIAFILFATMSYGCYAEKLENIEQNIEMSMYFFLNILLKDLLIREK